MANEPITPPAAPPPPSSAASAAKPITPAQLQREISPKPPEIKAEQARPALPPIEEQKPSPKRPDFKAALRRQVVEKSDQSPATESADPTPPLAPKAESKAAPEAAKSEAAPSPAIHPTDEVPQEQLRVLPHDKPDTARRIKAIIAERDAARKEAQSAKSEYEKAKAAPSTPPEELQKLRTEHESAQAELMRLRRLYDLDNDAEFKAKYREPVRQAEATISDTLKKYGFSDGTMKAIADEGGFGAFSASNKTFTVQEPDPENPGQSIAVKRTASELARGWLQALNVQDGEAIRATLGKQALLRSEEQAAIKAAQSDAKSYFENQTKAQREAAEQARKSTEQMTKDYESWLSETEGKVDWLKDKAIPDNASEADKTAIAEYNEFNKQLRAQLKNQHPTNALEYGQLKLEAAESHHLRRTLGQKDARIAELEAELKKAKGAMRTTPRGGSILKGNDKAESKKPVGDGPTDFKSGLRARILGLGGDED